jgi:shikimate kinase
MEQKTQFPTRISRLVLIGFMGAGKSTVGRLLAQQLQWQFFDADTVLEERAKATIAEIFVQQGEPAFRQLEAETIGDLLTQQHLVLAVGGGAVETESTRTTLLCAPETYVVFLEAPLEIMIARCEQQPGAAIRPVLQDRERLRSRFDIRLPHYRKAHLVIETATLSPADTARKIIEAVSTFMKEKTLA